MDRKEIDEKQFAWETLERYSGTPASEFCSNLIITNFPRYVKYFAETRNVTIHEGSMFTVAHSAEEDITILDFKIGSPAAALVVDLCSFLPVKSAVLLGMCAGLRRRYEVGEYLIPTASIRCEGTSDFYFPPEVPALGNFLMQRAIARTLDDEKVAYHVGITFTTNLRFWEFNEDFIARLKATRAQALELECATLFMASYKRKFTLGALLLISDLPLDRTKIKTKESANYVFDNFMEEHVELGVKVLKRASDMQAKNVKGAYK